MIPLVFLAAFAGSLRCLAPGLATDDVPEMILAALRLDVTHPPGYPLFALTGRLFALLPAGGPAFRLNLLSAAAGAGSVAAAFALARALARNGRGAGAEAWAAVGAVLLWSSPTWRWQSSQADKYMVHAMLAVACASAGLVPGVRPAAAAGCFGTALAHHPLSLFLAPLGLPILRRLRTPRAWLFAATAALLPFSLKPLYPAIRAAAVPPTNWGEPAHARALWSYLAVRGYAPKMGVDLPAMARRAPEQATFTPHQLGAGGTALAAAGWAGVAFADPFVGLAAAASWIGTFCFALQFRLDPFLVETYHAQNVLLLCVLLGAGLPLLLRRLSPAHRVAAVAAAACLAVGRVIVLWPANDFSRAFLLHDLDRGMLRAAPPGAALFAGTDYDQFALQYLTAVDGLRPDVALFDVAHQSKRSDYWPRTLGALGVAALEPGAPPNPVSLTTALDAAAAPRRCLAYSVLCEPLIAFPVVSTGTLLISRRSVCAARLSPADRLWARLAPRGAFAPAAAQPWNRTVLAVYGHALDLAAEALLAKRRPAAAQRVGTLRARLLPDEAASWTAQAALLSAAGAPLEALAALERAARLEPGGLEAYAAALDLVRAAKAWRALPAFANLALAHLPLSPAWAESLRGALARNDGPEGARALAIGLAEIAVRRGDELESGRTMLPNDPRRPKAILALDLLAIRLDPGWARPYARAARLSAELGLTAQARALAPR